MRAARRARWPRSLRMSRFDAFAVCEIESGDALALATRFALQWGGMRVEGSALLDAELR